MNSLDKKLPEQLSTEFSDIQKQIEGIKKEVEKGKINVDDKIKTIQERIDKYALLDMEEKNVNLLNQQLNQLKKGIEHITKKDLGELESGIKKSGAKLKSSTQNLSNQINDRPKQVVKNIQKSAENITTIAKGNDKNRVANRMQKGIDRLLK